MTNVPHVRVDGLVQRFDLSKGWLSAVTRSRDHVVAVDNVSFAINRRETFGLVGESGSGKSTVARAVAGIAEPSGGDIWINGVNIHRPQDSTERRRLRRHIQMIFQDPYSSLNPRWRVKDIVAEPLKAFQIGESDAERYGVVTELLAMIGLSAADGERFPHEFSGGQRQRIAIARAISTRAQFIACDEPTSALDVSVQAQILNLMRSLQERFDLTYLFISHNLAVVRHMANRVGVMYLGRLVEIIDARDIFRAARHPYTRMLVQSVPDISMKRRGVVTAPEKAAAGVLTSRGCAYASRCPMAAPLCQEKVPELIDGVACHFADRA